MKTKEPKYAIVNGYWKDDKVKFEGYIIKLGLDVDETEDDKIFYYVNGEHSIKEELMDEKTADEFVVTKYELTNSI